MMRRIRDMIDQVIRELKSENENGYYTHTIEALEKIKSQFEEEKEKPVIKRNNDKDDSPG